MTPDMQWVGYSGSQCQCVIRAGVEPWRCTCSATERTGAPRGATEITHNVTHVSDFPIAGRGGPSFGCLMKTLFLIRIEIDFLDLCHTKWQHYVSLFCLPWNTASHNIRKVRCCFAHKSEILVCGQSLLNETLPDHWLHAVLQMLTLNLNMEGWVMPANFIDDRIDPVRSFSWPRPSTCEQLIGGLWLHIHE